MSSNPALRLPFQVAGLLAVGGSVAALFGVRFGVAFGDGVGAFAALAVGAGIGAARGVLEAHVLAAHAGVLAPRDAVMRWRIGAVASTAIGALAALLGCLRDGRDWAPVVWIVAGVVGAALAARAFDDRRRALRWAGALVAGHVVGAFVAMVVSASVVSGSAPAAAAVWLVQSVLVAVATPFAVRAVTHLPRAWNDLESQPVPSAR